MAIIINIKEENNRLDFSEPYSPIVCGNTNYKIKFEFSEEWQNCEKKAAIFVIEGNKLTVDFEGDELSVPSLPNAAYTMLSLVSADENKELSTTSIKIRLVPTVAGGDYSEFNQLTNYLQKVLGAINKIENGNIIAKTAITAKNVSNPNLLINGDFRVNQRGQSEYTESGYTVDRWRQTEIKTIVNNDKTITINNFKNYGRLVQQLEDIKGLKGKTVTLSVKFKSVTYTQESDPRIIIHDGKTNTISSTIPNGFSGVVTISKVISENATSLSVRAIHNHLVASASDLSVTIEWVKLEIGETPTTFIPRLYSEELSLCQRYCFKISVSGGFGTVGHLGVPRNASTLRFYVNLNTEMRTAPSITNINTSIINLTNGTIFSILDNSLTLQCLLTNMICLSYTTTNLALGSIYNLTDGNGGLKILLDAEIY